MGLQGVLTLFPATLQLLLFLLVALLEQALIFLIFVLRLFAFLGFLVFEVFALALAELAQLLFGFLPFAFGCVRLFLPRRSLCRDLGIETLLLALVVLDELVEGSSRDVDAMQLLQFAALD